MRRSCRSTLVRSSAALLFTMLAFATSTPVASATIPSAGNSPASVQASCNYTSNRPVLRQGSTGLAVKQAQCLLNASMGGVNLAVDGSFGPATTRAVRRFQDCASIGTDGVIGSVTWDNIYYWADRSIDLCTFYG